MDAETLAESRLSAAARTGDEDKLDWILRGVHAPFDLFRNLHDLLFLKSFCNLDQVAGFASLACQVHVTDIVKSHYPVPFEVLGEYFESLRLFEERSQFFRLVPVRHAQQKSVPVHCKTPYLQIAGACKQSFIIMVRSPVKRIIVYIYVSCSVKKLYLVFISKTREQLDSLFRPYLMPSERHVGLDDLMHPCCDPAQVPFSDMGRITFDDIAVVSFRNRSSQDNPAVREHILCSLAEKETERIAVNASAHI